MKENVDTLNHLMSELRSTAATKQQNLVELCRLFLQIAREFLVDDTLINKIARNINMVVVSSTKSVKTHHDINPALIYDANLRGFLNLFQTVEEDYRISDLPNRLKNVQKLKDRILVEPLKNFLRSVDRYENIMIALELDEPTVLVGLFFHHIALVNALVRGQNLAASYATVADGLYFLPVQHHSRKFFHVQLLGFNNVMLIDFFRSHHDLVKSLLLYYLALKPLGSQKFIDENRAELEEFLLRHDLPDTESLIDAGFLTDRSAFRGAVKVW